MIRHAHVWDTVLRFSDRPVVQRTKLAMVVLLLTGVVLLSCLTLGLHNLCERPDECQLRDHIYIAAVHVVNSIADLLILSALPWRIVQTRHVLTGHGLGCDWHGNKSTFLFFRIPHVRRKWIMMLLLWNALFHYSNHILRIVCYRTYNAHIRMPGLLITNIFVALSVSCLVSAQAWIAWECWLLVKEDEDPVGRHELLALVRRLKKHYPLDEDDETSDNEEDLEKKSVTTQETPCGSLGSQSDDEFDEVDLVLEVTGGAQEDDSHTCPAEIQATVIAPLQHVAPEDIV